MAQLDSNIYPVVFFYNIVSFFGSVFLFPLVFSFFLSSRKRRENLLERLGLKGLPQKRANKNRLHKDKPIWVHALSVGEVFSAVELVDKLARIKGRRKLLFSASTTTGYKLAAKILDSRVDTIFFYPYDLIFVVRKIIRRIDPSVFVLIESDIWPNMLFELQRQEIPVILVNGRLSPKSFKRYRMLPGLLKPIVNAFSSVCVQSAQQAERFERVGLLPEKIHVTGNIKFDRKPDSLAESEINQLRKSLALSENHRIFLAGSTHPGEEEIIAEAFARLKTTFQELILILAPRDPRRADEICEFLGGRGWSVRKMHYRIEAKADITVIDVIGLLGHLYALADIAFIGGSLIPFGGHNPLEPAAFSKPIFFGPFMGDFPEISDMLLSNGGAIRVNNADEIFENARRLLKNRQQSEKMGAHAYSVFQSNQGAVEKVLKVLDSHMPSSDKSAMEKDQV